MSRPSFMQSLQHTMAVKHWLMKAEPDSRIVKGKDVKVSDSSCLKTTTDIRWSSAWVLKLLIVQYRRLRVCSDNPMGRSTKCRSEKPHERNESGR